MTHWREKGWHGLHFVEHKYKLMEIKAAMKLCQNMDPFIWGVQQFEERTELTSLMKEAHKFAEKLKTSLSLEYPE